MPVEAVMAWEQARPAVVKCLGGEESGLGPACELLQSRLTWEAGAANLDDARVRRLAWRSLEDAGTTCDDCMQAAAEVRHVRLADLQPYVHAGDATRMREAHLEDAALADVALAALHRDGEITSALMTEADAAGLTCDDCFLPGSMSGLDGTWSLHVRRRAWSPQWLEGVLAIHGDSGVAWLSRGVGSDVTVHDVRTDGFLVHLKLEEPWGTVRVEATTRGSSLEGRMLWTDDKGREQVDAFTGTRRDVPRFDEQHVPDVLPIEADPSHAGLDTDALDRLIVQAEDDRSDALVVVSDGRLVAERWFGREAGPMRLASVTKPIAALSLARPFADGRIASLDVSISRWFPEMSQDERREVTLRDVLTHVSGLDPGDLRTLEKARDSLAYARAANLSKPPRTEFAYNNRAIELVAGIVEAECGRSVQAEVSDRIFAPLGISDVTWATDAAGHSLTYAGLTMRPLDLARIGQLIADGGRWRGRELLPKSWIDAIREPSAVERSAAGASWFQRKDRKGALVALFHTGSGGQELIVYPGVRLVIVRMADFPLSQGDDAEMPDLDTLADLLALSKLARMEAR